MKLSWTKTWLDIYSVSSKHSPDATIGLNHNNAQRVIVADSIYGLKLAT